MLSSSLLAICIDIIGDKKYASAIFGNLSKGFDALDHNILLDKLELAGLRVEELAKYLIPSYLIGRSQFILYNNHTSSPTLLIVAYFRDQSFALYSFLTYMNDINFSPKLAFFILFAE